MTSQEIIEQIRQLSPSRRFEVVKAAMQIIDEEIMELEQLRYQATQIQKQADTISPDFFANEQATPVSKLDSDDATPMYKL